MIYELATAMDFLHSRIDRPSNLNAKTINNSLPKTIKEKLSKVEYETLEIKDENLQLLLEEFPEWAQNKKI